MFGRQQMGQPVEHLIADEAAGAERERGGHIQCAHRGAHGLDRQAREVGPWAVLEHGLVDRLQAGVVGDARVDQVDRDPFQRDFAASPGLAQGDHQGRPPTLEQIGERDRRLGEGHRQDRADQPVSGDRLAIEAARDLGRRIDRLAGERLESGNQDDRLAHRNTSRAIRATLTTIRARAVGTCERITPYWSGSSSSTAGTMLKLAAIGVSRVPQ